MQRLYIFVFLICIIIFSCDEGVIPEGKYREKYILSCILKPDTDTQLLNLAYSSSNRTSSLVENLPIKDAELNIWFDDEIRRFNTSSIDISDTVVDGGKLDIYQNTDFVIEPGTTYEVGARLKDGKYLKATTKVPQKMELNIFPENRKTDPSSGQNITIRWDSDDENYKVARAFLVYEKPVDGEQKRFKVQIPEKYVDINGKLVPSYPKPDNISLFELKANIIDNEIKKIGEGVSKKYEIVIKYIYIELYLYDKHLTKYYESTRNDRVSGIITVDKESYSNIEGGEGIFASYAIQKTSLFFDFEYIFSLGYTPEDIIE